MPLHIFPPLLLSLLIVLVSSCGFQLRGQGLGEWPDKAKHFAVIDESGEMFWLRLLLPALKQRNIQLDEAAERRLLIKTARSEKKIASYDASGRAAQYTITEKLSFAFQSPIVEEQIPLTQLSEERTYNFNANNLSGKTQEERLIQQELRQHLIQQLLLRIQQHLTRSQKLIVNSPQPNSHQ